MLGERKNSQQLNFYEVGHCWGIHKIAAQPLYVAAWLSLASVVFQLIVRIRLIIRKFKSQE